MLGTHNRDEVITLIEKCFVRSTLSERSEFSKLLSYHYLFLYEATLDDVADVPRADGKSYTVIISRTKDGLTSLRFQPQLLPCQFSSLLSEPNTI